MSPWCLALDEDTPFNWSIISCTCLGASLMGIRVHQYGEILLIWVSMHNAYVVVTIYMLACLASWCRTYIWLMYRYLNRSIVHLPVYNISIGSRWTMELGPNDVHLDLCEPYNSCTSSPWTACQCCCQWWSVYIRRESKRIPFVSRYCVQWYVEARGMYVLRYLQSLISPYSPLCLFISRWSTQRVYVTMLQFTKIYLRKKLCMYPSPLP